MTGLSPLALQGLRAGDMVDYIPPGGWLSASILRLAEAGRVGARLGPEAYWRDPHRVRPRHDELLGNMRLSDIRRKYAARGRG